MVILSRFHESIRFHFIVRFDFTEKKFELSALIDYRTEEKGGFFTAFPDEVLIYSKYIVVAVKGL